jgi:hypothetical protein
MPVVTEISLLLTEKSILRRQEIASSSKIKPSASSINHDFLSQQKILLQPAIAYEIYLVQKITSDAIYLNDGQTIQGRVPASGLKKARGIAVVLCTIGPLLEETSQKYFSAHELLKGFLLDGFGSAAIDSLASEACRLIQDIACSSGSDISSPYSPGMHGWKVEEISHLLQLAPAAYIGIHLTGGGMLYPRKSIAMIIGLGRDMPRHSQAESCTRCNLKDSCRHRLKKEVMV